MKPEDLHPSFALLDGGTKALVTTTIALVDRLERAEYKNVELAERIETLEAQNARISEKVVRLMSEVSELQDR